MYEYHSPFFPLAVAWLRCSVSLQYEYILEDLEVKVAHLLSFHQHILLHCELFSQRTLLGGGLLDLGLQFGDLRLCLGLLLLQLRQLTLALLEFLLLSGDLQQWLDLGEELPPGPVAELEVRLAVTLNDMNGLDLLNEFLELPGLEREKERERERERERAKKNGNRQSLAQDSQYSP